MPEYYVICPYCKEEINLWDIAAHVEECKKKKGNESTQERPDRD